MAQDSCVVIFNADDLGQSETINRAIAQAFDEGVLTSASLMVGGFAWKSGVSLARLRPQLGVGLHLVVLQGRGVLSPSQVPSLLKPDGSFGEQPFWIGLKYYFSPTLQKSLKAEIEAQFQHFESTGLILDHVNGHLHYHLHPTVFHLLIPLVVQYGRVAVRLPREDWKIHRKIGGEASGFPLYIIFRLLVKRAISKLCSVGIPFADSVWGLLQTGRMKEDYVISLLHHLPQGIHEIYFHPDTQGEGKGELEALLSQRIKEVLQRKGIKLGRYREVFSEEGSERRDLKSP